MFWEIPKIILGKLSSIIDGGLCTIHLNGLLEHLEFGIAICKSGDIYHLLINMAVHIPIKVMHMAVT